MSVGRITWIPLDACGGVPFIEGAAGLREPPWFSTVRKPNFNPAAAGVDFKAFAQIEMCQVKLRQKMCGPRRYYGRKMLYTLMTHADFEKMLEKYVLPKDLPYVKETVGSLRQKVRQVELALKRAPPGSLIWGQG